MTMIRVDLYIKECDWTIHAFFAVSEYWVEDIMDALWLVGCDADTAKRAYSNLSSGELNNGICYSNYNRKESIIVIAKTSSAGEFLNSIVHELSHLQGHICDVYSLPMNGEDIAYIMGDVALELYPHIKHLLCDCCRRKTRD